MKAQYEKIVRLICGDNWETEEVPSDERDGGYGVSICLACLQGAAPRLGELSEYIGTPPHLLEVAYKRLQINGVFSSYSPILDDKTLMMSRAKTEDDMMNCMKSWCHIAGLASGFIGKARLRQEMSSTKRQSRGNE